MSNVILFGECSGVSVLGADIKHRNFIKSNALLRLSHFLRRTGKIVLPIHHFSSFSMQELKSILDLHIDDTTQIVGVSTTFISPVKFKTNESQIIEPFDIDEFDRLMFIVSYVKTKNSKIKIVIGGPHIIRERLIRPKDMKRWRFDELFKFIDYAIEGQGEIPLSLIASGKIPEFEKIGNVRYINGEKFPIVDFSEISNSPITSDMIQRGEALSTELAHGCIFNCEFCGHGRFLGKKVKEFSRSFDSLRTEIVYNFQTFGTTTYMFLDDMINDDPAKIEWLIKIREETGIPIEWVSYARLETITKDFAHKLLTSGCRGLYFGVESFKKEVGPKIGKCTDPDRIIKSLTMLREVFEDNVLIKLSMIAGLPGETLEEFKETIDFLLRSEQGRYLVDRVSITPLNVYRQDKGEISKSRNYPFSEYKLDQQQLDDFSSPPEWVSPWGTKKAFTALIGSLYKGLPEIFHFAHPFYFQMFSSFGEHLVDFIRNYRTGDYEKCITTSKIRELSKEKIGIYKKLVQALTPDQLIESHNQFWQTFQIHQ